MTRERSERYARKAASYAKRADAATTETMKRHFAYWADFFWLLADG